MSKSELEYVGADEFDALMTERLRTEELVDDVFYTFMGRVHGLAAQAVKAVVRLEQTDIIPHSSELSARTRMVMTDADLRPTMSFDSNLTHGFWTPQSHNTFIIQRSILRSPVKLGYFVPNEDFLDPSMIDEWASETNVATSSELIDA